MLVLASIVIVIISVVQSTKVFDVTEFGAKGDGKSKDTEAVHAAVAACENASTGCEVLFPAGGVFLTGSFDLPNNSVVRIDGVVLGSPDPDDYPLLAPLQSLGGAYYCAKGSYGGNFFRSTADGGMRHSSLVHASPGTHNVTVTGSGEVNGNGLPWLLRCHDQGFKYDRPHMIQFEGCADVQIIGSGEKGLTFNNSANWNTHLYDCDRVFVQGIQLLNPVWPELHGSTGNTDGLDIDSCRDVEVRNLTVSVNDNTLCVKSGLDAAGVAFGKPSERILFEDITLLRGGAMAIGSESSGGAHDITFRNIRSFIDNPISIKSRRGRGGIVQNVTFENIHATNVSLPLKVDLWYFCGTCADCANCTHQVPERFTPVARSLTFRNVSVMMSPGAKVTGDFDGLPESPIETLILNNVTIRQSDGTPVTTWQGTCKNTHGHVSGGTFPVPPCMQLDSTQYLV